MEKEDKELFFDNDVLFSFYDQFYKLILLIGDQGFDTTSILTKIGSYVIRKGSFIQTEIAIEIGNKIKPHLKTLKYISKTKDFSILNIKKINLHEDELTIFVHKNWERFDLKIKSLFIKHLSKLFNYYLVIKK